MEDDFKTMAALRIEAKNKGVSALNIYLTDIMGETSDSISIGQNNARALWNVWLSMANREHLVGYQWILARQLM